MALDVSAALAELQAAFDAIEFELADLNAQTAELRARVGILETPPPALPSLKLAPVTYFYPTTARTTAPAGEWARVRSTAQLAIANPSSGPGTVADANYAAEINRCLDAGLVVLGYVPCTYGARPIADVVAECQRLFAHYPRLNNIFLDEVPTADTAANKAYLSQVRVATPGKLCLNPGTTCPEWFMTLADVVMIAETTAIKYLARTMPPWAKNYAADRFYHCVHDCALADMPGVLARMRANNAGYVYVTDGPYNVLPTYYDALVPAARAA